MAEITELKSGRAAVKDTQIRARCVASDYDVLIPVTVEIGHTKPGGIVKRARVRPDLFVHPGRILVKARSVPMEGFGGAALRAANRIVGEKDIGPVLSLVVGAGHG